MRHAVQREDGTFVMLLKIPGCSPPTTYTMSTGDSRDAHDFGSRVAAEQWVRKNGFGKVVVLTDSGDWPVED